MSVADSFFAALYGTMATSILARQPTAPLGTVAMAMGMVTLAAGASEYLLGVLRAGQAVQFVPAPIVAGCKSQPHPA